MNSRQKYLHTYGNRCIVCRWWTETSHDLRKKPADRYGLCPFASPKGTHGGDGEGCRDFRPISGEVPE